MQEEDGPFLHEFGKTEYTADEVSKDERGRKKDQLLGAGGSEAAGDPVRADGKQSQELIVRAKNKQGRLPDPVGLFNFSY